MWNLTLAFGLEFECGFGHFDVLKMIMKRTMKTEMLQIKRCKLKQFDEDDTIGISVISIFGFASLFSVFRLFSFETVSSSL